VIDEIPPLEEVDAATVAAVAAEFDAPANLRPWLARAS